ncbi:hypothetical protein BDY19DRAFT_915876 [Irpex rosettiformis]|uniref:Uncharacterized protein n=1 Tax=Irpex rosettiformis TaxID=378272 RepID=A0ACB8ULJ6_9APHY|nr:hypothetical protein BDY19DRAFT_915876 [Irpex rosettiformis]
MVRAHVKPPPEEKKEASQKKKPHSKTGLWACKINDCNKCFAREADLKRHQRTTKGHSQPGYACPQCDATFTRTDALRRHQKSRHNGVIVESSNSAKTSGDDSDHTDASMSSPSRDPSPGKEEPQDTSPPKLESAARANYYRSQAARPHYGSPLPPPPAIFIEGGYSHAIAIPTSAARLQWPSTPPWSAEGSPAPPPPPQLYPLSSYYTPSSYYRHGPPILPPGHPLPYPPDYMAHVMHPGGPPPPGIYHAHAPSISATRSANAEDSDSEPDEDDDEDDQDEEHSIGQCAGDDEKVRRISISDQQQKRAEDDNGTRSKDERCSSPVDEDDFERESTAKVSPSTPPSSLASILGPSRSGYFEDLEEDTLSPRMRDVALDGPLLIMAREPLTSLRA